MKKMLCIALVSIVMLVGMTTSIHADTIVNPGVVNMAIPLTGDITSVLALALAGVAAIGGLLLRKSK